MEWSIETGRNRPVSSKLLSDTSPFTPFWKEICLWKEGYIIKSNINYRYELKEASSFWGITCQDSYWHWCTFELKGCIVEFHMITTTYTCDIPSSIKQGTMHSVTCTVKSFVEPTTPVEAIQPTQVSFAPWNSLHSLSILLPWGPESQFQPQAAFFDVVQHLRFTHLVHASQSSQVPHQVTCHNMRRTDSKTADNLLIYLYYVTSQATNLVTISNMYSTNFAKAFAGHDVKRCGTVYHDIRYVLSCTQECSRREVRIHMNTLNSSENVMNRLIDVNCI